MGSGLLLGFDLDGLDQLAFIVTAGGTDPVRQDERPALSAL